MRRISSPGIYSLKSENSMEEPFCMDLRFPVRFMEVLCPMASLSLDSLSKNAASNIIITHLFSPIFPAKPYLHLKCSL